MVDRPLFRFSHLIEVRFADLDLLGHVNHAIYFTYMQTARVRYFNEVLSWGGDWRGLSFIVARAACDYELALGLEDAVRVCLRAVRLGDKSFDFEYVLLRERDQAVAARASTVQVVYDYRVDAPAPIPDLWRAQMTAYEPGLEG
jgi:acyl-CoA thioester hydrolase